MNDCLDEWCERIREAAARASPLAIVGGASKDFYGRPWAEACSARLSTVAHSGIVDYEPSELSLSARAGTPLAEIEEALASQGQMLAFEPPHFAGGATLGGTIAAGLSGPRRAAAGAARDFVLGAKIIDGRGQPLAFGGRVMKNVAGYDVSRLLTGSLGTLGLITEVSLKVLPLPAASLSLRLAARQGRALELMNGWAGQALPITASAWEDAGEGGALTLRLAGAAAAVRAAQRELGGEPLQPELAGAYWRNLRDQRAPFFDAATTLWRLSLPSTTPPLDLFGTTLIEWGGALRWLRSSAERETVRAAMARIGRGAHATLFRASLEARAAGVFQPLASPLLVLHRELKRRFDPAGVLNPGRIYAEF